MVEKRRGLGKSFREVLSSPADWMLREDLQVFFCPVEHLDPNPYQPRQALDGDELNALASSIAEKGVLQPLIVTKGDVEGRYQIIAGERRWRAAKQAGLTEVPVILRELARPEQLEIALIENIQRRDLSCIEEAMAYARLHQEFGLSHDEIARRVGKSRSAITNTLRLISLPQVIQQDLVEGRITMGHARALLAVTSEGVQLKLRDEIIARGLSVRATEEKVYRAAPSPPPRDDTSPPDNPSREGGDATAAIEQMLRSTLGLNVRIRKRGRTSGQVVISFRSEEELQTLVHILQNRLAKQGELG